MWNEHLIANSTELSTERNRILNNTLLISVVWFFHHIAYPNRCRIMRLYSVGNSNPDTQRTRIIREQTVSSWSLKVADWHIDTNGIVVCVLLNRTTHSEIIIWNVDSTFKKSIIMKPAWICRLSLDLWNEGARLSLHPVTLAYFSCLDTPEWYGRNSIHKQTRQLQTIINKLNKSIDKAFFHMIILLVFKIGFFFATVFWESNSMDWYIFIKYKFVTLTSKSLALSAHKMHWIRLTE